jgi:hypothetical protein
LTADNAAIKVASYMKSFVTQFTSEDIEKKYLDISSENNITMNNTHIAQENGLTM